MDGEFLEASLFLMIPVSIVDDVILTFVAWVHGCCFVFVAVAFAVFCRELVCKFPAPVGLFVPFAAPPNSVPAWLDAYDVASHFLLPHAVLLISALGPCWCRWRNVGVISEWTTLVWTMTMSSWIVDCDCDWNENENETWNGGASFCHSMLAWLEYQQLHSH